METIDPEIKAMAVISSTLDGLGEAEVKGRVLRWAVDKYAVILPKPRSNSPSQDPSDKTEASFTEFVDLLDKADPQDRVDKVLTAAYWLQVVKGSSTWQTRQINDLLKNTGHGLDGINHVLDVAQSRKPTPVRQIAKGGKTQQARKTYKLTSHGINTLAQKIGAVELADSDSD
jgi:hypothetical protein